MARDNFTLFRCSKCEFNFDLKDLENKKLVEVVTIFGNYFICEVCDEENR